MRLALLQIADCRLPIGIEDWWLAIGELDWPLRSAIDNPIDQSTIVDRQFNLQSAPGNLQWRA
jgi:hypothetical protein